MSDTTKTSESVIHRRRADDWQTLTRKTWTEQDHDEATSKADEICSKVYGLSAILKVCAFAAEARRTLDEIEDALAWRVKVRDDLRAHVNHMTNWQAMTDASGDALQFIAQEMERATDESANLSYRLAGLLSEQGKSTGSADHGRAAA